MDPIQPQLRATQAARVEVLPQNGATAIVTGGIPLLEGEERDGLLYLRFTELSGAHAEFDVTGASSPGGLDLSGAGTVHLGGVALHDATVRVTPAGLEITSPIEWAGQRSMIRFEAGTALGHWQGRFEARETLPCLMTKQEVLRTSITIELDAHARRSTYVALAVLDGRNIKVPTLSESHSEQDGFLSHLRHRTLAAVREFLLDELAVCEAKLAAVDSNDDRAESAEDLPVLDDHAASDSARSQVNPAVRRPESVASGYLPTSLGVARPSGLKSNAAARGYLEPLRVDRTTVRQGYLPARTSATQGYLPASLGSRSVAAGYLPNSRKTELGGSAGYLPPGWSAALGQASSTRATSEQEQSDRTGSSLSAPRETLNVIMEFQRIAYGVLRCKDLLRAVEAAESQGAGA